MIKVKITKLISREPFLFVCPLPNQGPSTQSVLGVVAFVDIALDDLISHSVSGQS